MIFPVDTDMELYMESHTELYAESMDMEYIGAEPWLDNSTAAWLDADICEALIKPDAEPWPIVCLYRSFD